MAVTDYTDARKESIGYRNLLTLKWNGDAVDWDNRVTRWPNVKRSVSNGKQAFVGVGKNFTMADSGSQDLWGSFYGVNGTNPLWSQIQFDSKLAGPSGTFSFPTGTDDAKFGVFKFGEARFGDLLFSGAITKGRTLELTTTGDEISFELYDDMEDLSNARFIWDYVNLKSSIGSNVYGTVKQIINATTFIVEESSDRELRNIINNLDIGTERTFTREWERLGNLGQIGTDAILPGDKIKFSSSDIGNADAGSALYGNTAYVISSGSFYVRSGVGTFGTIEVSRNLININEGDFIYKRSPLVFEGNPAEIIYEMLTCNNSTFGLSAGSINQDYYSVAKTSTTPMNFRKVITNEGSGAVLSEIKEISETLDGEFFFDRSGKWCWIPYRPAIRSIDVVVDFYDGLQNGTDNIIGDVAFTRKLTNVYSSVTVNFAYDNLETDERLQFRGISEATNSKVPETYNGYQSNKDINSYWIQDQNEADIVAQHFLDNHATAYANIDFTTSLYGLESDLYKLVNVTHRSGSMTNMKFRVMDIDMSLNDDRIGLELVEVREQTGYGLWTPVDAGSNTTHTVTGTSTCGWGWLDTSFGSRHGTIHTATVISGGTYLDIRTLDGSEANLGSGGYAKNILIGQEILTIDDDATKGLGTLKYVLSGQHTTNIGTWTAGVGFVVWPNVNTELTPCFKSGTIYNAPTGADWVKGTVHEINTGSYGTVWRWF